MTEEYIKGSGTGRGGWRGGGRPKGSTTGRKTDKTERINQALTKDEKAFLLAQLEQYRARHNS